MKLFSEKSKFMKTVNGMADGVLLNLCFLLCCIPVLTIGNASSALYTALRRRSLGYPAVRTFFESFLGAFRSLFPAWVLLLVLDAAFGYSIYLSHFHAMPPATLIFAVLALILSLCAGAVMPAFHSRFDCSFGQLIRNTFLLVVSFPVRSVLVGALSWFWVIAYIFTGFDWITPFFGIWFFFYFTVIWLLNRVILKHPFAICIQQSGLPDPDAPEEDDEEEEEEENK